MSNVLAIISKAVFEKLAPKTVGQCSMLFEPSVPRASRRGHRREEDSWLTAARKLFPW